MRIHILSILLLPVLLGGGLPARGDDLAPREVQMQRRIDDLESRLAEMESIVRALQAVPEAAEGGARPAADAAAPEAGAARPEAAAKGAPVPLQAYYNNGLQIRSADGAFDIRVGGRIQFDTYFYDADDQWHRLGALLPEFGLGREQDGVAFRRARLAIHGRIHENTRFSAQYDFAVDSPGGDGGQFADVYLELHELPFFDKARIGHFQEPFSLEETTSNLFPTFMERSLANVFTPSFNTGLTVEKGHFEDRLHWVLGIFKTTDFWPSDNDSNEAAGYGVTGRITGVPWASEDGRSLLHLGASFTRRNPDGPLTYRQRPESYLAERYVNTGVMEVGSQFNYGVEGGYVRGPLSIEGEYIVSELGTKYYGDRTFSGYYGAISWLATGEQRPYSKGAFGRILPDRPFRYRGEERGWGAWELALRYSHVDLNDGPIRGGRENNVTFAVNWYLNANTRIMMNYIYAKPENILYSGNLEILQARFQVDF